MITFSRKQKPIAEINITPFTDVILVLLIIFMVTTPLILQSNIRVNLPSSTTGKPMEGARQISIMATNEGMVYLDNKLISRKALKSEVAKLHQVNPGLEVILFSDKMVRFKDIVGLLDILNELGIKNLNIATKTE
ncbi:MAG: biopolymer transporter ExbD [Candidatus Omnitrophica bacterium]|jgi:biopolymer transport protein ExbD|nr:biopolymer transporter ExbD [Candidatus Omnitrophota bacterium]MDD5252479.1 biopolymer transporter ExbD [Candidatus Omnitrophota bacterium]